MLAELMDGGGIETVLRFVQYQQLGTAQLHRGNGDPLEFTGGQALEFSSVGRDLRPTQPW